MAKPRRKYKVMKEFRIDEISLVDQPAQPGARITIMKRAESGDGVAKGGALTTSANGHSHVIDLHNFDGKKSHGMTDSATDNDGVFHSHPWVMVDEEVVIGESAGHSHEVAVISKLKPRSGESHDDFVSRFMGSSEMAAEFPDQDQRLAVANSMFRGVKKDSNEPDAPAGSAVTHDAGNLPHNGETMTPEEKLAKAAEDLEAAQARAERAEKVAQLSDAEKAVFEKRNSQEQDAFLSLTPEQRRAEVAKAADANPVVYTDGRGREFRKNDDPRLVEMAKDADAARQEREEERAIAKAARIAKMADDHGHLPGERDDIVVLLEAVDGLPTEQRDRALKVLKAHNDAGSGNFEERGTRAAPQSTDESAYAQIQKAANELIQKDPDLTRQAAVNKVLNTPAGSDLYAKHLEEISR